MTYGDLMDRLRGRVNTYDDHLFSLGDARLTYLAIGSRYAQNEAVTVDFVCEGQVWSLRRYFSFLAPLDEAVQTFLSLGLDVRVYEGEEYEDEDEA